MAELESSLHLFQPTWYGVRDGSWHTSCETALSRSDKHLTWDETGLLTMLAFGYPSGDRTFVQEIRRRPWLSEIQPDGGVRLEAVPPHDTVYESHRQIAEHLLRLLCEEAVRVCQKHQEIYLLLSGGLDSRIVAGVVARLAAEGRITAKPIAVTWGAERCRDVVYARETARLLGIQWKHVALGPQDLVDNIEVMAVQLACLGLPSHLHAMTWFKNVSRDALVLAGSYGDSVGRAEFSGRHLLELEHLAPGNPLGLLKPAILAQGLRGFKNDLKALHDRTPDQPHYVLCEHEMQAFYMRSLIAHVMGIINQYCTIYQMFTHPDVYGYMWSLHPALRFDDVYVYLLEMLHPGLARLPWARTNRAMRGPTEGADPQLTRNFHDYTSWIRNIIYSQVAPKVDPDWYEATGLFDASRVRQLSDKIHTGSKKLHIAETDAYGVWLWLAAFRRFVEWAEQSGRDIRWTGNQGEVAQVLSTADAVPENHAGLVRRVLRQSRLCYELVKHTRRFLLKRQAMRQYPPRYTRA